MLAMVEQLSTHCKSTRLPIELCHLTILSCYYYTGLIFVLKDDRTLASTYVIKRFAERIEATFFPRGVILANQSEKIGELPSEANKLKDFFHAGPTMPFAAHVAATSHTLAMTEHISAAMAYVEAIAVHMNNLTELIRTENACITAVTSRMHPLEPTVIV